MYKLFKQSLNLVGQTSAGAAHSIDYLEVDDHFMTQLPKSYNINPVTKKDWEGTAVNPDIKTIASDVKKNGTALRHQYNNEKFGEIYNCWAIA